MAFDPDPLVGRLCSLEAALGRWSKSSSSRRSGGKGGPRCLAGTFLVSLTSGVDSRNSPGREATGSGAADGRGGGADAAAILEAFSFAAAFSFLAEAFAFFLAERPPSLSGGASSSWKRLFFFISASKSGFSVAAGVTALDVAAPWLTSVAATSPRVGRGPSLLLAATGCCPRPGPSLLAAGAGCSLLFVFALFFSAAVSCTSFLFWTQ